MNFFVKLLLFFTLMIFFSACGQLEVNSNALQSSSQNHFSNRDLAMKSGISLVKQSQILRSYSSCLDLPLDKFSTETVSTFYKLKGNLSSEGHLSSLSSPLFMAVTQLAGEVCSDLIEFEKTRNERKYFSSFDLNKLSVKGIPPVQELMTQMSRSCWSRQVRQEEINKVSQQLESVGFKNNKGRAVALFLCTASLSNIDLVFN